MRSVVIEGVDRLGKDTLIQGIQHRFGFFQELHYQKPLLLDYYLREARAQLRRPDDALDNEVKSFAAQAYQKRSFSDMFELLSLQQRFIMNRAHLGEVVYSPRYRNYDGNYVFELEDFFIEKGSKFHEETLLVLLHTSDFSFITNDGLSFDWNKKEEEQNDFIRAFDKSKIKHKLLLDVCNGNGGFVPKQILLDTVTKAFEELPLMPHHILNVSWSTQNRILRRHNMMQVDPKKVVT